MNIHVLFLIFQLVYLTNCDVNAQSNPNYYVKFHANISESTRSQWIGHVWVEFISIYNGEVIHSDNVGFYPVGIQREGNRRSDVDYTFTVSKSEYFDAYDWVIFYEDHPYIFGVNDCRSFAKKVALAINLRVPNMRVLSPAEWLGKLVDQNSR